METEDGREDKEQDSYHVEHLSITGTTTTGAPEFPRIIVFRGIRDFRCNGWEQETK